MHLQAKQSISPNNSPNVSQALRAGKYMVMVKGHGKKAWRWRGLCGAFAISPRFGTGYPWGAGLDLVQGAGACGCDHPPEVSTALISVIQGKGPNPPGVVTLAPCLALPQPPGYHVNWEK